MDQNLRLGKIAGIPVGLNWSVLFVFALLAWELAGLVLPHVQPGHPVALYWVAGTVTTVLFFGSLLAHEAAHALVAKHHGIAVRSITLWLFGGVSELGGEALTPGVEFRIAVVGPLTSFAVALVAGAGSLLLHDGSGTAAVVAAALGWLAWINVLLGGFNLMPAAPLDGGRILRAALWHRSGDRVRATLTSSRCGEVFGYVARRARCPRVPHGRGARPVVRLPRLVPAVRRTGRADRCAGPVVTRRRAGRRPHDARPRHLPGVGHRGGARRPAAPPLPLQHVSPRRLPTGGSSASPPWAGSGTCRRTAGRRPGWSTPPSR